MSVPDQPDVRLCNVCDAPVLCDDDYPADIMVACRECLVGVHRDVYDDPDCRICHDPDDDDDDLVGAL